MMDYRIWEQRREEMMREAEQSRLARALRNPPNRHGSSRASRLAWELERIAGRLRKLRKAG